jgi:hypothetical protein
MSESNESPRPSAEEELLRDAIPIEENEAEPSQPDLTPDDSPPAGGAQDAGRSQKIRHNPAEFRQHEDHWNRTPNTTGRGAIHVKTFMAKLRPDAIEHMDRQINEWLDAHPQYEVKFATTTIGTLKGKNDEEALFVNVWV